jgi:hypothetical protein
MTHQPMRLMDDGVVLLTHGGNNIEALDKDVSMLVLMNGNSRCLWSRR